MPCLYSVTDVLLLMFSEKEKELIKKKLKATKDLKGKNPGIQEAVPISNNNEKGGKGGKGKGGKSGKVDPLDQDDEIDELEAGFNDELVKKGTSVLAFWCC